VREVDVLVRKGDFLGFGLVGRDLLGRTQSAQIKSARVVQQLANRIREERKSSEVEKAKEVEVVEPPKVEEVEEVEEVPPPKEDFVYAGQLAQIKEIMALEGGDMDETIKKMLVEHKGDLARVVPLLLR
jgi:Icc-related predicted phosphoesterase